MPDKKNINNVKIAISGKSGCGNTTVSRLLADALGVKFINYTFRSLAIDRGMDFNEVLVLAEKDDSWDRDLDSRQVELAREVDGCVLGSRLAIWMLPEADIKVFLTAKAETRAKRIKDREGGSLKKIAEFTANRDARDHERYERIYKINNDDYFFADLVIETDNINPMQITEQIISEINKRKKS